MNNTNKKTGLKKISLRQFITVAISLIVTVVLLCSILFYYIYTAKILTHYYENSITGQLNQINQKITEQIEHIDSIIPLFLSNTLISDALSSPETYTSDNIDKKINIDKEMSYIYYSSSLASKNYVDALYITSPDSILFHINTSGILTSLESENQTLLQHIDKKETGLNCAMFPNNNNTLFFTRNLFNNNTGNYMGTFIINVNVDRWISYCSKEMNLPGFFCLYNSNIHIVSDPAMQKQCMQLRRTTDISGNIISFQELELENEDYFVATQQLEAINLTSSVSASKDPLMQELNDTLKAYLILLACTIIIALFAAIIISQAITRPIAKMIYHINQIASGSRAVLPPRKMYREFSVWTDAFNKMLKQLDIYYNDNFQKQLLLKDSEIKALQTQMNPHFLFNVLNTIAWKAQISDNEEIYQMVISLGELLKANALSKEKSFITLEEEMKYVKFYIYLQQMRFEDKLSCDILIPEEMMSVMIPCFCIQPLVENAIVHGLEPKAEKGKLIIQVLKTNVASLEISIIDNGIGFREVPDIRTIAPSEKNENHAHIGLHNLDKRLELLFNENARLKITSIPNVYTAVSFRIPDIE